MHHPWVKRNFSPLKWLKVKSTCICAQRWGKGICKTDSFLYDLSTSTGKGATARVHTQMKIAQCPTRLSRVSFSNLHASFSPASASAKLTEQRGAQSWTKGDSNCPENFSQTQILAWPECKGYGKNICLEGLTHSTVLWSITAMTWRAAHLKRLMRSLWNCSLKAFSPLFLLLSSDFLPITVHLPKETVKTSRFKGVYHMWRSIAQLEND